jgi:hypothetical protein
MVYIPMLSLSQLCTAFELPVLQAMQKRDEGLAAPLKYYHNLIKTRLIQRFAGGADKLLDLACGRGGDLHKWMRSKIKYARGYDIAEREVRGPQVQVLELAEPIIKAG